MMHDSSQATGEIEKPQVQCNRKQTNREPCQMVKLCRKMNDSKSWEIFVLTLSDVDFASGIVSRSK